VALRSAARISYSPVKVRAQAVHLVDEADARHGKAVGLPPDRLRLGLDAGHRIKGDDAAVEDAQRTLHLGRKVDVAGGIDQVDLVALPLARDRGRLDRDPALALLRHKVGHGGPVIDVAQAVRTPGVKEHALCRCRLAGIDVGNNANVPCLYQVVSRHRTALTSHTNGRCTWLVTL